MEVRMREIVVLTDTGVTIWDDCQLMHGPAVAAAKSAAAEGLRCHVVVRYQDDASPIYYVKDDATMSYVPIWFEPKAPKPKKVNEAFVGPKRPPGRPRIDKPESRMVSVQLTSIEIDRCVQAGGSISAGIRKAIALLCLDSIHSH